MDKCPFSSSAKAKPAAGSGTHNAHWWPNQLRVDVLNQHSSRSNPLGETFNYREAFKKLDYAALKADLRKLLAKVNDQALKACVFNQQVRTPADQQDGNAIKPGIPDGLSDFFLIPGFHQDAGRPTHLDGGVP